MGPELITRRFISHGRVQGVGYRWFVRENARQLGLTGQVRNLSDGTVETIARGRVGSLDILKKRLLAGPVHAHVSQVTQQDMETERKFEHFEVVY